jgi:hypothetical protein
MWKRLRNIIHENLYGILGTIAFHMILVIIFLAIKISSTRNLIDSLIMIEFEESEIQQDPDYTPAERDIEFERYVADYLEDARSNIPVNVAERVDEQLSTDRYVDEVQDELDENRNEDWLKSQERLKDLLDSRSEDMVVENEEEQSSVEPGKFEGKTNIFYSLENRYHLRLPVPVYKCEGEGVVEVQILVDQRGLVVQAQVPDLGSTMNDICLAESAKEAAMKTRFNSNFNAPLRQQGTITYYFQAQ